MIAEDSPRSRVVQDLEQTEQTDDETVTCEVICTRRRRLACCPKRYTRVRLQGSMFIGVLNLYHAYWIFAAMVIGLALAVNFLLAWFIEWFQYTAGRGIQGLPVNKYLAVLLRSCLLIRLLSQLLRIAVWLLQDALRLEGFQVYRCILCGGAVREMVKGNPDCIRAIGSPGGWKYHDTLTGCLDVLFQVVIYASFDLLPPVMALLDYLQSSDITSSISTFSIYACGVALVHVLIFHFAETINDVVAKFLTWKEFTNKMKQRRFRRNSTATSRYNSTSASVATTASHITDAMTPTRPAPRTPEVTDHPDAPEQDVRELVEQFLEVGGASEMGVAISDSIPSAEASTHCSECPVYTMDDHVEFEPDPVLPEREHRRSLLDSFATTVSSNNPVDDYESDAPWNVCLLLCNCISALGQLILGLIACGLYMLGIWQMSVRRDYTTVILASLFILAVGCYRFRHVPKRCASKFSRHAQQQPPQRWSRGWRHFWRWAAEAQRWGELNCGLAEEHSAQQYELFAIISVLQAALFIYIKWWSGVWLIGVLLFLQVLRRLTLEMVKPWGWVVGVIEAIGFVALAVTLNGLLFDAYYALGTFIMAMSCQFTLNRVHSKAMRILIWATFALQLSLVCIVSVSMMAVIQDNLAWTNFCDPLDAHCRSFSTDQLPFRPPAVSKHFCDMSFPLQREDMLYVDDLYHQPLPIKEQPLRLPDFALFSALAYEGNASFETSLNRWFPGWTVDFQRRVDHLVPDSTALHQDWTTFFELGDPSNTTTVFAIRGTLLPLEILQDLNIWAPIAIPQLASLLGPDLTSVSAHAVLVLSTGIYGQWIQKQFYSTLLEHVKERVASDPGRRFYITGHSLGGGLAKIVTMETKIPSITFSSPGVDATRFLVTSNVTKQEEQAKILHQLAYTVIPDNDIVPRVDSQLGTQIQIGCKQNPLACHHMGETLCEMLHVCGSDSLKSRQIDCNLCPSHRHLFPQCQSNTSMDDSLGNSSDAVYGIWA